MAMVFTRRFLVTNLSNGHSSACIVSWLTLHNWILNSQLRCTPLYSSYSSVLFCSQVKAKVKVKVKVTLRLTVSHSVLVSSPVWGLWPDIYYCLNIQQITMPSWTQQRLSKKYETESTLHIYILTALISYKFYSCNVVLCCSMVMNPKFKSLYMYNFRLEDVRAVRIEAIIIIVY
jgi:hypothetical protein